MLPEIDAYRISKIATYAITGFPDTDKKGTVEYGYTPGAANTSALRKFKEGIKAIREAGYNGQLACLATDAFLMELELELAGQLRTVTWSQGGINTMVPAVDGVPIKTVPSNRMYTSITLYDGKTAGTSGTSGQSATPDQKGGGYVKASGAMDINFEIMPMSTPIAISKQDIIRIFNPEIHQDLNAWRIDYRRFHDLWVLENKCNGLFVNVKDANPAGGSGASGGSGTS